MEQTTFTAVTFVNRVLGSNHGASTTIVSIIVYLLLVCLLATFCAKLNDIVIICFRCKEVCGNK